MSDMPNIIRKPTESERKDFTPVLEPGRRQVTPEQSFNRELSEKQLEATKKGLPFGEHAARAEWRDHCTLEKNRVVRQFGYMKVDEVKPLKMDWKKFSDLKNFEVLDEGEVYDDHLSKKYKKPIYLKKKVYKYKGFANKYTVMEDGMVAVNRTKE